MPNAEEMTRGAYQPTEGEQKVASSKRKNIFKGLAIALASVGAAVICGFGGAHIQKYVVEKEPVRSEQELPDPSVDPEIPGDGAEDEKTEGEIEHAGTEATLTLEEQQAIASKIFSGSRENEAYDVNTIKLEGTQLVGEGEKQYLAGYISVMEEGKKVMYRVGYEGITTVAEIPTAEVRVVKLVNDIEKYVALENYVEGETAQTAAEAFIASQAGIESVNDVFVKVTGGTKAGVYTSQIDYIAITDTDVKTGKIVNEGQKYNVGSYNELIAMVMGLDAEAEKAPEAEQELTR